MADIAYTQRESAAQGDWSLVGLSQRLPPSNLQAEQALLGAILANNRALDRVVGFLKAEHFADPINARIYSECCKLILSGHLADAVTLKETFQHSGELDEVGGTPYLASLLSAMVGIINAGEYGRTVLDCWVRRQLIEVGAATVNRAFISDADCDGEAQIRLVTEALMRLASSSGREAEAIQIGAAARSAVERAEAIVRGEIRGVLRSGLGVVDRAVGDWWPECFYILGGRPGMGKSSLALQIAVGAARQLREEIANAPPFSGADGVVLYFSLEMPAAQLGGWAACQIAQVNNEVLRGRRMVPREALAIVQAQQELDTLPIEVIDAVGMSGPAIALRAQSVNHIRRVRMVVVDTVQKVISSTPDEKWTGGGDNIKTSRTTSALKDMSRSLRCPVLGLAHLRRDVDQRDNPRPRAGDLLYAGEGDADVLAFLFREERYLSHDPPPRATRESDDQYDRRVSVWREQWRNAKGRAELIIAKARSGAEGSHRLGFRETLVTFYELGEPAEAPPDLWDE
jgi:replicative DNA helicase